MVKEETWDKDIPTSYGLTEGHHEIVIKSIAYVNTSFADKTTGKVKKALQITFEKEGEECQFRTSAWDIINFLKNNKPVIGKTFCFDVTGSGTGRRFKNLELK